MTQAIHARLDAQYEAETVRLARARDKPAAAVGEPQIVIHEDLAAAEKTWRAFEEAADGSVFQTFAWQSACQRHIGERLGFRPAIVVVQDARGTTLALFALSIRATGIVRELAWLGSDLCDYNGPLLAPGFSERFDRDRFLALWREIACALQVRPRLHYDLVKLTKMPERIGAQFNPMRHLAVTANPSGAYQTHLTDDWESFYTAKRSSATRRRDRTKRKRLSDLGAVQFVMPDGDATVLDALDTLMAQKARSFARMGVGNMFALPGRSDFYRALATEPGTKPLVHVSRLDVGATPAALNLGLVHKGCYYHLLASYDDGAVSRFGPGAAHLHDLMQYAITRKCSVFDFTIGDEGYKRDWADTVITLYDHIEAATWRGVLVATPVVGWQRLKRWIKQTPVLWSVAGKVRALIGSLRAR